MMTNAQINTALLRTTGNGIFVFRDSCHRCDLHLNKTIYFDSYDKMHRTQHKVTNSFTLNSHRYS